MTTTSNTTGPRTIGSSANYHVQHPSYLDLTRPSSSVVSSTKSAAAPILLSTRTTPILIAPDLTALVIIDMQNFFLSSSLGRTKGPGHAALTQLHELAIPAARAAGIRVVWLNWGLTDADIESMPPAIKRAFGDEGTEGDALDVPAGLAEAGERLAAGEREKGPTGIAKSAKVYRGLGTDMGTVVVDGEEVPAGRMLVRDSWNAALHPPLDAQWETGRKLSERPDAWVHKDRMSGIWGKTTMLEEFLEREGLRTLLFAGVNTDQCVSGTLTDAFSKGYDCVLLSDGCGTTSPGFAQQGIEFNAMKTWGFLTDCRSLADAVERAGLTIGTE